MSEADELALSNQHRMAKLAAAGCTFSGFDIRYLTLLLEELAGPEVVAAAKLKFGRDVAQQLDVAEKNLEAAQSQARRAAIASPGPIPPMPRMN